MKKAIGLVLVLALLTLSATALAEGGTVTAIGTGTVTLVPDMATFTVGITTRDTLVVTAQAANAEAMQAVLDTLISLGISPDDLQTDSYSVYPVYDYSSSSPAMTGYEVSNIVTVTLRDTAQLLSLPSLLDAAVEAGANNVYSLSFQSSEHDAAYDQALKAAAQDALRRADMMAQAIGRETGDVIWLEEVSSSDAMYNRSVAYAMESSYATPIETGMVTVTAQVQAVVEMN